MNIRRIIRSFRRGSISKLFAALLAPLAVSFALMYAVKATGTLRVSREGEIEGLDIHEHGMPAYPEYVIHGYDPTPHAVARAAAEKAPAKALAPLTTGRA